MSKSFAYPRSEHDTIESILRDTAEVGQMVREAALAQEAVSEPMPGLHQYAGEITLARVVVHEHEEGEISVVMTQTVPPGVEITASIEASEDGLWHPSKDRMQALSIASHGTKPHVYFGIGRDLESWHFIGEKPTPLQMDRIIAFVYNTHEASSDPEELHVIRQSDSM